MLHSPSRCNYGHPVRDFPCLTTLQLPILQSHDLLSKFTLLESQTICPNLLLVYLSLNCRRQLTLPWKFCYSMFSSFDTFFPVPQNVSHLPSSNFLWKLPQQHPLIHGDAFQEPRWVPKTTGSTNPIQTMFFLSIQTYDRVNDRVQLISHRKRLTTTSRTITTTCCKIIWTVVSHTHKLFYCTNLLSFSS